MYDWLNKFQSAYGALANKASPRPTGAKSSWMKGVKGVIENAPKVTHGGGVETGIKSGGIGMLFKDMKNWTPEQWKGVSDALEPLVGLLQKRGRRRGRYRVD